MQVIHLDVHLALTAHIAGVCTAWHSMITTHYPDNDTTRMNQLSSWKIGKKTYTLGKVGKLENWEEVNMPGHGQRQEQKGCSDEPAVAEAWTTRDKPD